MSNVLQIGTSGQIGATLVTPLGFDPTTNGAIINVDSVACVSGANTSLFANTITYPAATFPTELYYGSPNEIRQPQIHLYTQSWINQFFHYPIQGTLQGRAGYMNGLVVVLERKVPGGGADPGSGKIPQLEVPTKSATTGTGADDSNPASMFVPFPVQTIIG